MKTELKTGDETMKAESTTGDETAKTQKQVVIYLLADDYIEVEVQPLTMGDLCEIVGTDRKVADFVKQMPVAGLQPQETGRSVISVLMLVEAITVQVRKQFAGIQCQCVLLGAEQLIVEWGGKKTAPWWVTILKTVCVSLIILTGSAFTIMTYDQDVDVAGVFGRIYQLFVGHVPTQPGILLVWLQVFCCFLILLFRRQRERHHLLLRLKWRNMNQISGIRLSKLIIG